MPANQMDLQGYGRFLTACAQSPAFETGRAHRRHPQGQSRLRLLLAPGYRLFVVRATRNGILERAKENAWFDDRPPFGPGRVDTFNPYKVLLKLPMDATVGTVDLPSIWNQRPRQGLWLHWDGNNDRVEERNKSAAIGAGATPKSLDLPSMQRIEQWLLDFPAPTFPAARIDAARAASRPHGVCHGVRVVPRHRRRCRRAGDTGRSGRHRSRAARLVHAGAGRRDEHHRRGSPVALLALPQDARLREHAARRPVAARAVPAQRIGADLRALLFPEERPATFFRAYDVYDWDRVGFVSQGADAEREGVLFDTTLRGNANTGHLYGTDLPTDRQARPAGVSEDVVRSALSPRPSEHRPRSGSRRT